MITTHAFDLKTWLQQQRDQINQALNNLLPSSSSDTTLLQAMRHSLLGGGKRLRPVLCLAAADICGGQMERVLPAACALEMIHTYSLIHDDLPALDNDLLRRGLPTCHSAFGEATAILAGDALLTRAFEILASAGRTHPETAGEWLLVIEVISQAAGASGMIEGQMQDLAAEGRSLTLEVLEQLHNLKTGALIRAAIQTGAILARATPDQQEHLNRYARAFGLAFQITDDLLNIDGDATLMGKAVGTDQARRKSTCPSILGLTAARNKAAELVESAIDALHIWDQAAEPLRALARYILTRRR